MPKPPAALNPRQFLLIVWTTMAATAVIYSFLAVKVVPPGTRSDSPLILPLLAIALVELPGSLYLRKRFMNLKLRPGSPASPSGAYVLAFAMAESITLFGLLIHVMAAWTWYWIFFLMGLAAFALNFPRRGDFVRVDGAA